METLTFALHIGAALGLGMVLGLERQWRQHPAGMRTNALVALGAALFTSLALLMDDKNSPTRMASYVVSGLGFLGGGVILREGLNVRGMTTAATIWCSGAIGSLCGCGFPLQAVIGTGAILFIHVVMRPVVLWVESHRRLAPDVDTYYRIKVTCQNAQEGIIRSILMRHVGGQAHMSLQAMSTVDDPDKDQTTVRADVFATERNDRAIEDIVKRISIEPNVSAVSWEKEAR